MPVPPESPAPSSTAPGLASIVKPFLLTTTFSLYVPAGTLTVSPGWLASTAAWIVVETTRTRALAGEAAETSRRTARNVEIDRMDLMMISLLFSTRACLGGTRLRLQGACLEAEEPTGSSRTT